MCFPFFRLRHNLKARYYIVPILLFAPLYNLPRFFEFETVKDVSFTCLDDQLDALNRNISSSTIDTQEKYNVTQNSGAYTKCVLKAVRKHEPNTECI